MKEADRLILYVVVRNDLASMTPGKAAAQASHASTQFMAEHGKNQLVKSWVREASGFGTCITLAANIADVFEIHRLAGGMKHITGLVFDPGYPVKDGQVTHEIGLTTCAYVFGRRAELKPIMHELPLL